MENNKNNNTGLKVIIVLLIVVIIILACILTYVITKNSNNSNNNDNNFEVKEEISEKGENNSITAYEYKPKCIIDKDNSITGNLIVDIDASKYNNIVEYIKEQENILITIKHNTQNDIDTIYDYVLSNDEIKTYLSELETASIKSYHNGGLGGVGVYETIISYEKSGVKHQIVWYFNMSITKITDGNIYAILDKNLTEPQSKDYCNLVVENFSPSIANKTFYKQGN